MRLLGEAINQLIEPARGDDHAGMTRTQRRMARIDRALGFPVNIVPNAGPNRSERRAKASRARKAQR